MITQMTDAERIQELEAEVAHADDLVDRLLLEIEELRMALAVTSESAQILVPA